MYQSYFYDYVAPLLEQGHVTRLSDQLGYLTLHCDQIHILLYLWDQQNYVVQRLAIEIM